MKVLEREHVKYLVIIYYNVNFLFQFCQQKVIFFILFMCNIFLLQYFYFLIFSFDVKAKISSKSHFVYYNA